MSSMKPICWTKWPASCCHFQTLARAKVYDELAASKWIQIALNLVYPKLYWFLIRCFPLQVCHSMPMYSPCWTSSSNPKFAPCSSRHIMRIILFGFGMFGFGSHQGTRHQGLDPFPFPSTGLSFVGSGPKKGTVGSLQCWAYALSWWSDRNTPKNCQVAWSSQRRWTSQESVATITTGKHHIPRAPVNSCTERPISELVQAGQKSDHHLFGKNTKKNNKIDNCPQKHSEIRHRFSVV